jgi:NDP-sugar pyrophosphorylase family protein
MKVPCTGLIMAGGRGNRMRASGVAVPKPLVLVNGTTLLERNFYAFVRAEITRVFVSVSDSLPEVGQFVRSRISEVAQAAGVELGVVSESEPLGNIGVAGTLVGAPSPLVVTYSDNLTTLDLRRVLRRHHETGADLTLAAHYEQLQMPYGELLVKGDDVLEYAEKPVRRPLIASAISVLSSSARTSLPRGRPSGMVDLFNAVCSRGGRVVALVHNEPWVDVNDVVSLARAERLAQDHCDVLEQWGRAELPVKTLMVAVRDGNALLEATATGKWTLPAASSTVAAVPSTWAVLDGVETQAGVPRLVRYELVVVEQTDDELLPDSLRWLALSTLPSTVLTDVARRVLARYGGTTAP